MKLIIVFCLIGFSAAYVVHYKVNHGGAAEIELPVELSHGDTRERRSPQPDAIQGANAANANSQHKTDVAPGWAKIEEHFSSDKAIFIIYP